MGGRAALIALAAMALALSEGCAAARPATGQAVQPEPARKKPLAKPDEPVKRQNFRARRPEEIAPWEGFEDCAFGPCVGATGGPRVR